LNWLAAARVLLSCADTEKVPRPRSTTG
jgi:hypothetical protein